MNDFEEIRRKYTESHAIHGDSPAALLTPKGRHEQRFRPVVEILRDRNATSLLDYGCGLGLLRGFFDEMKVKINYTGYDITPSFIESCRRRFGSTSRFELVEPSALPSERFDVVVCSGVFNLATSSDENESLEYVRQRVGQLLDVTNQVLVCDFLSPYVDFKQEGAQHIGIDTVTGWLVESGHRRFVVRHDLLPYEYTVVVYLSSEVARPMNAFKDPTP